MALTPSTMLELGTRAPDFRLKDVVSGGTVSLDEVAGEKGTLVMFLCKHCPYVIHVEQEIARLGRDYEGKAIGIVAICANDAEKYPDDGPESLRDQAARLGFTFPYLHDEAQEVARAYTAACTPDLFLFDGERRLVYRGQLDDSRPGSGRPVTGSNLRAAMEALLAGRPISPDQKPSMGCNIKWKPGREPAYF